MLEHDHAWGCNTLMISVTTQWGLSFGTHTKKEPRRFFYLNLHVLFLELHRTRKTHAAQQSEYMSKLYFTAGLPASLPFSQVTWQHHISILLFILDLLTWISTKGGYYLFTNLLVFYGFLHFFTPFPYCASRGFPNFNIQVKCF